MTRKIQRRKAVVISVIAVIVLTVIAVPYGIWHHRIGMRRACLNNLFILNEPLNCCIPMEQGLQSGQPIDPKIFASYMKGNTIPTFPSGVRYEIPFVANGHPKCPYHGDLLYGIPNLGLTTNFMIDGGIRHIPTVEIIYDAQPGEDVSEIIQPDMSLIDDRKKE